MSLDLSGFSDDEFLVILRATEPLPQGDDSDPAWDHDVTWDRLEFVLAAADEIGRRRLVEAIAPLFHLAALGDANDAMQGIRHGPEKAVSDEGVLAGIMLELAGHERPGCRRWAARELAILRDDPRVISRLMDLTRDPEPLVREVPCGRLGLMCQTLDEGAATPILERLREIAVTDASRAVRWSAAAALAGFADPSLHRLFSQDPRRRFYFFVTRARSGTDGTIIVSGEQGGHPRVGDTFIAVARPDGATESATLRVVAVHSDGLTLEGEPNALHPREILLDEMPDGG